MEKVLITDGVHPVLKESLEAAGYVCDYQPSIKLDQVHEIVNDYVGMIINSKIKVDRRMLDNAGQLRIIGRLGSGMEIIDLEYAAQKGVAVFGAPEGNCNAVGEHALGMLLALANNLLRADREVRKKVWRREANRGFELMGKTIGIIGFGHTGTSFARKLAGMDVKVLAYDKYKEQYADSFRYVQEVDLDVLKRESDVISFHLPLSEETHHLVDEQFIEACKDGVILINTSRGQVIKTDALLTNLNNKKVSGACLDVYENEKPETFSREEDQRYALLYEMDQVVLSPHIAGWTRESKQLLAEVLLKKILKN